MQYFQVRNWSKFQHYKDRNPPWIKLHNHLLDDPEFDELSDAERYHLLGIWMLASRTENKMKLDEKWVAKKLSATTKVSFKNLLEFKFIELIQPLTSMEQSASKVLVSEETEERQRREETEYKTHSSQVEPEIKYTPEQLAYAQTEFLAMKSVVRNVPGTPEIWADDLRKLIDIDKVTPEEIRKAWDWARQDDFWQTQCKHFGYLRKKSKTFGSKHIFDFIDKSNEKVKSNGQRQKPLVTPDFDFIGAARARIEEKRLLQESGSGNGHIDAEHEKQ